jgi:PAS domain S-box-containing protein
VSYSGRRSSSAALPRGYSLAILDLLPAAVYLTDATGRITYFNQAAVDLWGFRPELGEAQWCGSWKLQWPDGTPLPHQHSPMAISIKERRPVRGMEAVAIRPDGTQLPFLAFPTPLFDERGELTGAVNVLVDVSDRDQASTYAARLAAIVESTDDAVVSKDLNGVVNSWNSGAEKLFGYTADEMIGKPITVIIPTDHLDEEGEILSRIRRGERVDHYETIRRRKDGTLVEISLTVSPLKTPSGRIIGASKIARDITERRHAQQQQALLLNEMKHRMKNTLATVQAMATQSMPSAPTRERLAFTARVQALARAHDLLTFESWNGTALKELVASVLSPFQDSHRERFLIEGPGEPWLNANNALLLTIILHELATNAVKYGALSNATGRVRVSWEPDPFTHDRIKLAWIERGGPPVNQPAREGFGSRLIKHAFRAESGSVNFEFKPQGLTCVLEFALKA